MSAHSTIVVPVQEQALPRAREISAHYGLALFEKDGAVPEDACFRLLVSTSDVVLDAIRQTKLSPLRIDFLTGKSDFRRRHPGRELLVKAVSGRENVKVLDTTAGLAADSFLLASRGCQVTMFERSAPVACLLEDALQRAKDSTDAEIVSVVDRMTLIHGDAIDWMRNSLPEGLDVIYLDPMFPARNKSALVKKQMQIFQMLHGEDDNAEALLLAALQTSVARIVVKRPVKAPCVTAHKPSYQLTGKTIRYDVYQRG